MQLVIGPIFIKLKILGKRSSSQLISTDARVSGRSIGEHGNEETLTGHDGMREIDGLLHVVDATGSETEDMGGKTCATGESERSMVHEGPSVRIEDYDDLFWVCIARSWLIW